MTAAAAGAAPPGGATGAAAAAKGGGPEPGPPEAASGEWQCKVCTRSNPPSRPKCAVCGTKKGYTKGSAKESGAASGSTAAQKGGPALQKEAEGQALAAMHEQLRQLEARLEAEQDQQKRRLEELEQEVQEARRLAEESREEAVASRQLAEEASNTANACSGELAKLAANKPGVPGQIRNPTSLAEENTPASWERQLQETQKQMDQQLQALRDRLELQQYQQHPLEGRGEGGGEGGEPRLAVELSKVQAEAVAFQAALQRQWEEQQTMQAEVERLGGNVGKSLADSDALGRLDAEVHRQTSELQEHGSDLRALRDSLFVCEGQVAETRASCDAGRQDSEARALLARLDTQLGELRREQAEQADWRSQREAEQASWEAFRGEQLTSLRAAPPAVAMRCEGHDQRAEEMPTTLALRAPEDDGGSNPSDRGPAMRLLMEVRAKGSAAGAPLQNDAIAMHRHHSSPQFPGAQCGQHPQSVEGFRRGHHVRSPGRGARTSPVLGGGRAVRPAASTAPVVGQQSGAAGGSGLGHPSPTLCRAEGSRKMQRHREAMDRVAQWKQSQLAQAPSAAVGSVVGSARASSTERVPAPSSSGARGGAAGGAAGRSQTNTAGGMT